MMEHVADTTGRTAACRSRWSCFRLYTLGVILTFTALVAASGPHLVHHLAGHHDRHDQHEHHDHSNQEPVCIVFAFTEHTPGAEHSWYALPSFLSAQEPTHADLSLPIPATCTVLFQARAPPI
jgi:hypothetical protein